MSSATSCPKCKGPIEPGATSCSECGAELKVAGEEENPQGRPAIAVALLAGLVMSVAVVTGAFVLGSKIVIPLVTDEEPRQASDEPAESAIIAEQTFSQGLELFNQNEWVGAETHFERTLELAPEHESASDYLQRAQTEQRALKAIEGARQALSQGKNAETLSALSSIPESSAYFMEAISIKRRVKTATEADGSPDAVGAVDAAP